LITIHNTGAKRFPFNNFTYYLTLFSKFFSSFPHGTCSLSVSRQYLALDGIYHPFSAAFPNNATLRKCITKEWSFN
ncbi:Protein TAR1, partial [Nowakowskiella sp. JEL0078]